MGYLGAFLIGVVVAVIELVTRYRDDIAKALTSLPALFYVLLNGVIALFAATLLTSYYPDVVRLAGTSKINDGMLAVVAGFGSLAILRAGIMKVRVGSNEISVGPALIIEQLLAVIDRLVDRRMASYRGDITDELAPKIVFATHGTKLVTECLGRLTNASAQEAKDLKELVQSLTGTSEIDAAQKSRSLVLALLPIVGALVLRQSVKSVTS